MLLGGHDPDRHRRTSFVARIRYWIYKKRPLSYWLLIMGALLVFDIFVRLRSKLESLNRPVDPLVNYQILCVAIEYTVGTRTNLHWGRNNLPIVQAHPPTSKQERAVVTTMYTDTFAHGVATLGHSLQLAGTNARLILAYFPERISPRALCIAKAGGWELHPIVRIPPPHEGKGIHYTFVDQYSKLRLWSFDRIGVKSLVYLDADILVRQNFDEIFDLPYNFAAAPDVWTNERGITIGFNAGVMLLRPDSAVFQDMLSKLETADFPPEEAEQAFLNLYFGGHALRLPFIYNGNLATKVSFEILSIIC
jgi:hypothetical protein